jgi:hypothetical protein
MTGLRRWLGAALAAGYGVAPFPLAAQAPELWAGATVIGVRAQGEGILGGRTAGTVLGGLVTARLGTFELEGRYLQGALQPQDDVSPRRDLVQGQLVLGYHATPWLSAHTGARARAYVTSAGTERWLVWLLGARVESPIVGTTVRGHVALWRALALSANVGSEVGRSGRGGEAGVTLQLPSRPVWFRLAYGIDQNAVRGAARRETVEEFTLTVGVQRR